MKCVVVARSRATHEVHATWDFDDCDEADKFVSKMSINLQQLYVLNVLEVKD